MRVLLLNGDDLLKEMRAELKWNYVFLERLSTSGVNLTICSMVKKDVGVTKPVNHTN